MTAIGRKLLGSGSAQNAVNAQSALPAVTEGAHHGLQWDQSCLHPSLKRTGHIVYMSSVPPSRERLRSSLRALLATSDLATTTGR